VPLVEEGWAESAVAAEVARTYLAQCVDYPFDLLLLGCTHYPLMRSALRQIVGDAVRVEDPGTRIAQRVATMFPDAARPGSGGVSFRVTDSPDGFMRVAMAMGFRVTDGVRHVDLDNFHGATIPT
jgi:glutamate racemase